jgi:Fe-S-cluster containining protein
MGQVDSSALVDRLLNELQQSASTAERLLQQRPQQERAQIACGPGCGSCCVVNVSTLLSEGMAISRYLQRFSLKEQLQLAERLEALWQRVRGLDDAERLAVKSQCAFLNEQGSCMVYPVRPLLCRSVTSTDPHSCREALTVAVFDEEKPVLMYQYQQQLYESLFIEVAAQLEGRGLDGRSFSLTGLLRFLLKNPTAEAGLLDGQRLTWQELY